MKVIAVVSQKGGVGKSTLSLATAVAATAEGLAVAVIDLDPQVTASSWSDRREEETPVVISTQAARLPRVLEAAEGEGADLVVIDTAPRAEQAALGDLNGQGIPVHAVGGLATLTDTGRAAVAVRRRHHLRQGIGTG